MKASISDHSVDAQPVSRRVQVAIDGEVVAQTERPVRLEETGHRVRWYVPREDVRADVLRPSEKHTHCPFKGDASYHHVVTAAGEHRDVVWYYPDPLPAVEAIRDHLAFYDERVELLVDE